MPALPIEPMSTNEELWLLVAAANERAFAAVYDRTVSRVLGLMQRIVIDRAQSEEVAQEVYLAAWREADQFDPDRGGVLGWLYVRARRRAIDRVRFSQASRNRDMKYGIRDHEYSRDDVADQAETSIEHQRVAVGMKSLSAVQTQALELTYFGGCSQSEAAARAGVPLGTMKTRIRDGLSALRKGLIEPEPGSCMHA